MGAYHTVRQGEHISRIGLSYGFSDFRTIWQAPENADLRAKRPSPNVLFPGDILFIPERSPKELDRSTEQRHPFKLTVQPVSISVGVKHAYWQPVANAPCTLQIGNQSAQLTTDSSGSVTQPVGIPLRREENGHLDIQEELTEDDTELSRILSFALKIGFLDPVDEVSGQLARLRNLGYYLCTERTTDEKLFRAAIEEFQCENNLTVDGVCGPQTQAKLKTVYGC